MEFPEELYIYHLNWGSQQQRDLRIISLNIALSNILGEVGASC